MVRFKGFKWEGIFSIRGQWRKKGPFLDDNFLLGFY